MKLFMVLIFHFDDLGSVLFYKKQTVSCLFTVDVEDRDEREPRICVVHVRSRTLSPDNSGSAARLHCLQNVED